MLREQTANRNESTVMEEEEEESDVEDGDITMLNTEVNVLDLFLVFCFISDLKKDVIFFWEIWFHFECYNILQVLWNI